MATYTILARVTDAEQQNVQDWATIWGEIKNEIQQRDGEIVSAYAVLGDYDFQFTYEAADEEAAIKIAIAVERYGLDTRTHQMIEADRFGELVDDI